MVVKKKKSKLKKKQDIIKLLCNMNTALEIAKITEQKKKKNESQQVKNKKKKQQLLLRILQKEICKKIKR